MTVDLIWIAMFGPFVLGAAYVVGFWRGGRLVVKIVKERK